MQNYQHFVSIDVSKDTLDYAVVCDGNQAFYMQTENTTTGIKTFIKALKKTGVLNFRDVVFCMVDGIGAVSATQIIIATNEFKTITTGKKFACYFGVVPF